MLTPIKKSGRYVSIKADGKLHEKVDEGTEGAVLRSYELKDGTKGEKWELLYQDIKNVHIKAIEFEDSEFGQNILLTLSDGDNEVILTESTSSNFGTDLMKKLPNVDFADKLTIVPYAFTDEKTGKEKRGVTIYQKEQKLSNFFFDGENNIHGFPVPEGDKTTYDSDSWKVYYIGVKKFLVNYIKENIVPKLGAKEQSLESIDYPSDESIDPSSIPF